MQLIYVQSESVRENILEMLELGGKCMEES